MECLDTSYGMPVSDPIPPRCSSPRALFVHGAGARGAQWAIWRRRFAAAGVRAIAPDRSPSSAGLDATRWTDHLAQVRGTLVDLRRAEDGWTLVVGASLGGLLALAAVAEHPRGVALALVNPLPPSPWASSLPPGMVDGPRRTWSTHGRFASTARALAGRPFPERHAAFHAWRDESAALLREARAGIDVAMPAVPMLVIAAEDDDVVPADLSSRFALDSGASLLRVPGDHLGPVMGEGAAAAARLALAWWETVRCRVARATPSAG